MLLRLVNEGPDIQHENFVDLIFENLDSDFTTSEMVNIQRFWDNKFTDASLTMTEQD